MKKKARHLWNCDTKNIPLHHLNITAASVEVDITIIALCTVVVAETPTRLL